MGTLIDLTGKRFGRWTVLGRAAIEFGQSRWCCLCDCGGKKVVKSWILRNGESRSCGCLSRDIATERGKTHGLSRHPAYKIWGAIKKRCSPTAERAEDYHGRGIQVCARWAASFEAFWEDMGPTYKPGLTLERKDNDKGYSPENCVWADFYAQANNNRRNRWINTPKGRMTVAQAARAFGISAGTLHGRISRGIAEADLFKPVCNGARNADEQTILNQIARLQAQLAAIRALKMQS